MPANSVIGTTFHGAELPPSPLPLSPPLTPMPVFCCSGYSPNLLIQRTFHCLQVVNAGPSSKLGVDNTTGCLPDVLQFCSATATGQSTDLTCPSLAFRRPAAAVPNGTARVCSCLVHLYAGEGDICRGVRGVCCLLP